ncbi:MAG: TIGR00374 family protein [Flavobacterium sp. BFFFF2]|nr:MAG: TIGR00374 family protein [Flavobacterium sp. BFFFF2]
MNQSLKKTLTLVLPLAIGVGLMWYQFKSLSAHELEQIKTSLLQANYSYIYASLAIALYGYWARAYRWTYSLKHMGYSSRFSVQFLTVCVSYFVNLTLPRSGEITRAALLNKYEGVPFDKAFGTIIAERIVDLFLFFLFVLVGFIYQFDTLTNFLHQQNFSLTTFVLLIGGLVVMGIIGLLVWIYAEWDIIHKLKTKLKGLIEGMFALVKMPNRTAYLLHSIALWISYFFMFYITIFALPETAHIPFHIALMGFIFGSLAVGFTNGGLGAYPVSIALIFSLYGISNPIGTAFGWLVWTSQTLFTLVLGLVSYFLLPLFNRNK